MVSTESYKRSRVPNKLQVSLGSQKNPGASLILVDDIHCACFGRGVSHNSSVLRFTVTFRLALALEEPITVPPAASAHAIGFVASGFLDDTWIPKKNSYPIHWRDVPTAPASPH